jgi:VanZ family protein
VVFERIRSRLERLGWRPGAAFILLVIWGLLIVYGTALPFDFSANGELVEQRLRRLGEQPWRVGSQSDVISNVLLFLPWGFLLAIWCAGRGTSFPAAVLLAALTGALLSGSVEIGQLYAPSRTTSAVDLATNTLGSILGALMGWPAARRARRVPPKHHAITRRPDIIPVTARSGRASNTGGGHRSGR